jgi:hypothetical protein
LPPSGDRSKAVMTMVIVLLVSGWGHAHPDSAHVEN